MLNPVGGVSHLRVVEPMAALATDPSLATRIIDTADAFTADPDQPGIFIFHRPLLAGDSGIARVREIAARGWLVLCEFDDHPDYIPVLQRPDVQNFRAVHAVQTSTAPLAEVLRRDNPEIKVFANGVARMPDVANFRDPARLTMLFAGINREKEWQPYLDALNAVVRKVGERLHIVVVNDRALFEQLATPHKRFVPLCGYDTYQALLGASEISFAPLTDTPFNRCKSDLKFIEAAAHRVTALASRVVYEDSIRDGETGVLFGTRRGAGAAAAAAGRESRNRPRHRRCGAGLRGARAHAGLSGERARGVVSRALGAAAGTACRTAAARAGIRDLRCS